MPRILKSNFPDALTFSNGETELVLPAAEESHDEEGVLVATQGEVEIDDAVDVSTFKTVGFGNDEESEVSLQQFIDDGAVILVEPEEAVGEDSSGEGDNGGAE